MVNHVCPFCGQLSGKPMIFSKQLQIIFNYVWDNPGCTVVEIRNEAFLHLTIRKPRSINFIYVAMTHIQEKLFDTPYAVKITKIMPAAGQTGRPRASYKIIHRAPAQVLEGTSDGTL